MVVPQPQHKWAHPLTAAVSQSKRLLQVAQAPSSGPLLLPYSPLAAPCLAVAAPLGVLLQGRPVVAAPAWVGRLGLAARRCT
jgi:hypothetical protein